MTGVRLLPAALLLVSLLLIGCAAQSGAPENTTTPTVPTPTSTATPAPPAPPSPATPAPGQYLADFSAPGTWRLGETAYGQITLEEDVERIRLFAQDGHTDAWAGESFGDGTYEVLATQQEGPISSPFGMYFMIDKVLGPTYQFLITSNGWVWIGHYSGGSGGIWTPLVNDGMFYSEAVHRYLKSTNTLRVEAQGGLMSFYVNDTLVGTVLDFRCREGDIGLFVEAGPERGVAVEFDDFSYIPAPEAFVTADGLSETAWPLVIAPHWESGDTRSLEIIRLRSVFPPPSTNKTSVEMSVLEATNDGYVLRWDMGEQESDVDLSEEPALAQLVALVANMDPVYEVDADGNFLRLRNWEEIRAKTAEMIEVVLADLPEEGEAVDEQMVWDVIEPIISYRESFEEYTFARPIKIYHSVLGLEFNAETQLQYESLVRLGDDAKPFAAIAQFDMPRIRQDLDLVELTWSQTLDPETARSTPAETLSAISESIWGDPLTKEDLPIAFAIDYDARFVVDIKTGWILYLEYGEQITIGSNTSIDRFQIIDVTDTTSESE